MGLAVSLSALLLSTFLARVDVARINGYGVRFERDGTGSSFVAHAPSKTALEQARFLQRMQLAALAEGPADVNAVPELGALELAPSIWSWLCVDPNIGLTLPARDAYGSPTARERTPSFGLTLGEMKISGSAQYDFYSKALSMGASVSVDI